MDIAKLQEFFRNGTYILGPYMAGFESTAKDRDYFNGSDNLLENSRQVSSEIFGQWLMNAKRITVTVSTDLLDCEFIDDGTGNFVDVCSVITEVDTGVYGRVFQLERSDVGPVPSNPLNYIVTSGPANFFLQATPWFPQAGFPESTFSVTPILNGLETTNYTENYWPLFSSGNWVGATNDGISLTPRSDLYAVHQYGNFYFLNRGFSGDFKTVTSSVIELEYVDVVNGYPLTTNVTISLNQTFF